MAQPVWVLSVDLQTKTATFQSGMAEAAKSARGAFTDIKSGSEEMGREMGGNMMEARHGVMLLGEEFGIHLPRALTTFIASIGPIGAAMEAAFPFLAVAVGATLLIEALVKIHEAGEKLTSDQVKFGTAVENAYNQLDEKILQAGIRADELRGNHLGALSKQLELIDKQSMVELVHSFEEVAKAADVVFGDLKSHWYTFGIGSVGAKHALDEFQTQYDSLLARGKDGDASDLLKGTRESAEKVLALQKQAKAGWEGMSGSAGTNVDASSQYSQATNELKKAGVGFTEKEVAAQEALVGALQAQAGLEERIAALKKLDDDNASRTTAGQIGAQQSAAAREAAESMMRMGEQAVAADRDAATAKLEVQRASIAERLASDLDFANRETAVQQAGNAAQIAALDKYSKDYPNQLKALQDKAAEITQQGATKIAEITAKSTVAQANKDLQDIEQGEREKIEATMKGSAARLAAIDAAIKEEQSANMTDLASFRDLLRQRVEVTEQMTEEDAKLTADAGREAAANTQKMGELALAAAKEHQALMDSTHRITIQQRMAEEIDAANKEYALKLTANAQDIAALDKSGKDYNNKLQELQDKQKQLIQAHENEVTAIKEKAEEQRNARILSAEQRFNDTIANGLTQAIMGHKTFASMMTSIGNEVVTGMIQNALKAIMANDMTKFSDASAAARKAYLTGEAIGGPVGVVLGPVLAAAAFAGVMAFGGGGVVPGVTMGDSVPALLTPGEGVVPGGVMDGLASMARNGGMAGGTHYHAHVSPTYHLQALDAGGMDKILDKHSDTLSKHVNNELRKLNR